MTTPQRRVSERQERGAAQRLRAQRRKGSGSGNRPQDLYDDKTLYEAKTVFKGNRQITLKADALEQLRKNAAQEGRYPVVLVEIAGMRWVLHPEGEGNAAICDQS